MKIMYEDLIAQLREYAASENDKYKKQDLLEAADALEAKFKIRTSRETLTIQETVARLEEYYLLNG